MSKLPECLQKTRLTLQLGGTCWFHSCINGFLFTGRGRRLLNTAFRAYTVKNFVPRLNYLTSCPRRGQLNLDAFWRYVMYRMGKIPLFPGELKATKNLKTKPKFNGGSYVDLIVMCQKVFGKIGLPNNRINILATNNNINKNKIGSSPVFVDFTNNSEYIDRYAHGNPDFILNHVYISLMDDSNNNGVGHAITAFTCNNERYIYDSNYLKPRKLDWKKPGKIEKYARQHVGIKQPYVTFYTVYIRKEI